MVAGGVGVTVLPCTAASPERFSEGMVEVRPFSTGAPQRRVALAWRKSFPRLAAVEVLARAVRAARLDCVTYIEPGR